MKDQICFYNNKTQNMVAVVDSAMVPAIGSYIRIRKKVWRVLLVNYSLDSADDRVLARMRANIALSLQENES